MGETGDGSASELPQLLNTGLPRLINRGEFPNSFLVGSQTFSFIVISPQFVDWPMVTDVKAVLDYAIAHYPINPNRIYITGLSMGGGATWEFVGSSIENARRVAAIVPIAGASWPDNTRANIIAAGNVAVWATHNDQDPTVPAQYSIDYVNNINNASQPPMVPARLTIFNSSSHDAWTRTYNPDFEENGLNIYQWMLQYQTTETVLPVNLISYEAFQSGPSQVTIRWKTSEEINNAHFTIERSSNGVDFSVLATVLPKTDKVYEFVDKYPLKENNYYRLTQVDLDGSKRNFQILRVSMKDNLNQLLQISPNPATDFLNISLYNKENGRITVSLIDMNGRVLRNWAFNKSGYQWTQPIRLNNVVDGRYVLEVKGKSFREIQSFIKR
jgi:dienelactone hydrolase